MRDRAQDAKVRVPNRIQATRSEFLDFLSQYVRYKSINPDMLSDASATQMRECQDWLAEQLRGWGIFDEVVSVAPDPQQPNVLARRKGRGEGQALLFNGHSDVVPVTDDQAAAWTLGTPWGGEVVDGKLCGRGASDMKGGNAASLWAIKALAESGVELNGDLLAAYVSGEETGNHRIGVDTIADSGYRAPFGVLVEPTNLEISLASVGEFYFLIRVEGLATSLANRHLSIFPGAYGVPVAGVNAIDKMFKIQRALRDLEREWGVWQRHPLMMPGNMNINFSRIHGGEIYSAMADSCELTGSVLYSPSLTYEQVRAEFLQAIDGVVQSDYWLREHPPQITLPYILDQKPPINLPTDHPGCQATIRAFRAVLQREPILTCTTATTDGNYLFARGQNLLTFGPGSEDAGVHGPNEYVEVGKLIDSIKVYALFAMDWCGVAA